MNDLTLKPVINRIDSLYEGQLSSSESLEAARNLTGFMGLLLECVKDNGIDLDDDAPTCN